MYDSDDYSVCTVVSGEKLLHLLAYLIEPIWFSKKNI